MPVAYDKLIPSLKKLLPSQRLALLGRSVAFIQRLRAIRASTFVWAVVLSRFGSGQPGFEQARQWYRRLSGVRIWPRPFQMRFKAASAVTLFEKAFEQAVAPWRSGRSRAIRHPLGRHFADVVALDSTYIQVADCLRSKFKGIRGAAAAIKALLAVSVCGLLPLYAEVVSANHHDTKLFPPLGLFRPGSLLLFDQGFVVYERLRDLSAASLHYLCPMRQNGNAIIVGVHRAPAYVRKALRRHPRGVQLRAVLPRFKRIHRAWDLDVLVAPGGVALHAAAHRLVPARLVITPGRRFNQYPYLTNLATAAWPAAAISELYRLRWQVELVFKELKQHLNLETTPTKDRHAVKIFAWASLIALALSRTVTAWLCPLVQVAVGLAVPIRPMLVTRALRGTLRVLARALTASPHRALEYLRELAEDLLAETRGLRREDSFSRLQPLLEGRASR